MALYTRAGDGGFSKLPRGAGEPPLALRKDDPRLEALGSLDELNSALGWCLTEARRAASESIAQRLQMAQRDLFRIGAAMASLSAGRPATVKLELTAVEELERQIDAIFAPMPPLRNFLLPGGVELAARLHVARSVSRRAERAVVAALAAIGSPTATLVDGTRVTVPPESTPPEELIMRYLNRLSDLLYALTRQANRDGGGADVIWRP